jgi:hypothetical protein
MKSGHWCRAPGTAEEVVIGFTPARTELYISFHLSSPSAW